MRAVLVGMAALCIPALLLAHDQSGAVKEVVALNAQLEAAVASGDAAMMERLFAAEFRLHNAANRILDRGQVLEQFRSGATRFSDYDRVVEVAYQSGDVVILMGEERVTPMNGVPVRRRFTSVWQRGEAGWRQVARQSTNIAARP